MKLNVRFLPMLALLAGSAVVVPTSSYAAPITGQLSIAGDATVSATTLTFLCDLFSPMTCPLGSGQFLVTGPLAQSGSFSALANTGGNIKSIDQTTTPINQSFMLSNFMTFLANPDVALDLMFIAPGTGGACPPAPTMTCTPLVPALVSASNPTGRSPFNLTDTSSGSTAAFSVSGQTREISTGLTAPFNGTFSATFTNTPGTTDQNVASILAQFARGSITSPYDGKFVAIAGPAIPEPATEAMLGGGLLLIAALGYKRRRRN